MQILTSFASLTLIISTIAPGIVASPLDQSPANPRLDPRAGPVLLQRQCSSPAQINLANDPGNMEVGHCGWKMWLACTSLAAGACIIPCAEGG